MNSTFDLHKTIAFVLNAIIIGLIIYFVFITNSDKSPILFMVFYPSLTILNLIISITLGVLRMKQAKIYKQIVFWEILLFIPLVLLISEIWKMSLHIIWKSSGQFPYSFGDFYRCWYCFSLVTGGQILTWKVFQTVILRTI